MNALDRLGVRIGLRLVNVGSRLVCGTTWLHNVLLGGGWWRP